MDNNELLLAISDMMEKSKLWMSALAKEFETLTSLWKML